MSRTGWIRTNALYRVRVLVGLPILERNIIRS